MDVDDLENQEELETGAEEGAGDEAGDSSSSAAGDNGLPEGEAGEADVSGSDDGAEGVPASAPNGTQKPVVRKDPTAGMTVEQQLEYWRKRANHFEGDYKKERTKRQGYERNGAAVGLSGARVEQRKAEQAAPDKAVEDMTPQEFLEHAERRIESKLEQQYTERQLNERVTRSEDWARKEYDGANGKPTYDEMINDVVMPFLKENPDTFQILRKLKNPAQGAYTLGVILRPDLLQQDEQKTATAARKDLVKQIDAATKKAVTIQSNRGGVNPSRKKDKAYFESLSDADFEKEIEEVKNS